MSLDAIRDVMKRSHTSGAVRLVLIAIASHADHKTGESYASRRTLALEANVSSSTVHLALGELLAAGEIEILVNGSGRKATTYRICSDSIGESLQDAAEPVDNPVATRSAARSDSIRPPVATRSAGPSIGGIRPEEDRIKTAGASTAPPGPTADAAGRRSMNSNGVPPDAAATLATLKADLAAKTIADRRAEAQRLRDLLGEPSTEPPPPPATAQQSQDRESAPTTGPTPPRLALQADTARDPDPTQPPSESSLPAPRAAASAVPPHAGGQARTATARQPRPRDRGHVHRGRKGRRGREPPARCTRSPATLNPSRKDPPWLTVNAT